MKTLLKDCANQIGIQLDDHQIEKLFLYKDLLLDWNTKINLTAITDETDIIIKHFIDSITISRFIPNNSSVIDVGTGAGFPGLVLKIIREDLNITLLDSLNKRLLFLDEVIKQCGLNHIVTIHGRAEDYGKNSTYREKFDIAVARAVASLEILSEYCLPFVKKGGLFIAMKGNSVEEINKSNKAIDLLGGRIEKIENFRLPHSNIERNIILVNKIKCTPEEYPRKAGIPEKKPIV